jgi:hypothetical protein
LPEPATPKHPALAIPKPPAPTPPAITRARKPITPPPAPAPAPPPTITLHVTTDPVGATVVLDGVRLGTAPYTATLPASHKNGWLKVRMQHYNAVRIQVPLESDVDWNVQLHKTITEPPEER